MTNTRNVLQRLENCRGQITILSITFVDSDFNKKHLCVRKEKNNEMLDVIQDKQMEIYCLIRT